MKLILLIVLALLFLASVLLNRAYRAVPVKELRRRARTGHDKDEAALYKAAACGEGLELLLWLIGSISAVYLLVTAANYSWWLAGLLILVAGFFIFVARPAQGASGWQWRAAVLLAPAAGKILYIFQPVFSRGGSIIKSWRPSRAHSGLYEKEDLLELLKSQNHQADSRFSDAELNIVYGALTFGDKSISRVMTPRAKLKMVAASEPIGPLLMDELHASGLSSFPVVKELSKAASVEVIATLYLSDLVDHGDSGKVRDVAKPHVYFINEDQNLRQALTAFIKTKTHLLVVVNNFEEVVGAVTIEQIVEQILGHKLTDEFDKYDSLQAVAGINVEAERATHQAAQAHVKPTEQRPKNPPKKQE